MQPVERSGQPLRLIVSRYDYGKPRRLSRSGRSIADKHPHYRVKWANYRGISAASRLIASYRERKMGRSVAAQSRRD